MNTRKLFLAAILAASTPVDAAIFCVNDSATLTQALSAAGSNAAGDSIRVRSGTFIAPSGGWQYNPNVSDQDKYLSISGGWDVNCGSQSIDSSLTKLSGGNARRILAISRGVGSVAELEISGLSLVDAFSSSQDWLYNQGLALRLFGHNHSGPVRIEHLIVRDNSSLNGNDALYLSTDGDLFLRNSLVVDNQAGNGGMGVTINSSGDSYVSNNTIVNNTALSTPNYTLGLDVHLGSGARYVVNNIVWGNAVGGNSCDLDATTMVLMMNNDVGVGCGQYSPGSIGNISVDPMFVSASDYRLKAASPLHNIGDNTPFGGLAPYDLLGMGRIQNGVTDLGAYETQASAIFKHSFD